jgi:hypothetical protein
MSEPQLGPYRVLGSLGIGGTAQVFKAEHRHLGQIRALKVLLPEISARPGLVERMLTEARAMARLRHPAIVEVFDCDVLKDGTAFIAMEYLRGEPMRSWLDRVGKLRRQPLLAVAIAGVVAEGLRFAHAQQVIHRDLKPENVLFIPDPADRLAFSLKILDFGIAKLLREEPLTRTRAGCVVGTPVYMAPEQWQPGSLIDQRTDIYALGCLLFELLCGRPPFLDADDVGMRRAHLELPAPTPASLEPGLPPALDRLVARMLAKDPADRPQTIEEVIDALEQIIGQKPACFRERLRVPADWAVVAKDTVAIEPSRRWTTVSPASWTAVSPRTPAWISGVRPFATDAWQGRGDPRKRFLLIACLAALGGCAVAGGILLAAKLRRPDPSPASSALIAPARQPRPAIPAAPEPASAAAPVPLQPLPTTPARAEPAAAAPGSVPTPLRPLRTTPPAPEPPAAAPPVQPPSGAASAAVRESAPARPAADRTAGSRGSATGDRPLSPAALRGGGPGASERRPARDRGLPRDREVAAPPAPPPANIPPANTYQKVVSPTANSYQKVAD